jgi:hypothetical protein
MVKDSLDFGFTPQRAFNSFFRCGRLDEKRRVGTVFEEWT